MKVDTLEAYNVPPDILEIWRSQIGVELLPMQEQMQSNFKHIRQIPLHLTEQARNFS